VFSFASTLIFHVLLTVYAPGHAADFAGTDPTGVDPLPAGTTPTGASVGEHDVTEHPGDGDPAATGAVSLEKTPFYKSRRFLISQAIAIPAGIGLLFVMLFPVVKAIAQHIVNVSKLNVDRVVISEPVNAS